MKGLNANGLTPVMVETKKRITQETKDVIRDMVRRIVERKGFDWSVEDDDSKECRFDVSDVADETFDYTIKHETSCDIVRLEEIVLTGTGEVCLVNELDPDEEDTLEDLNLEELFNLAILLEDAYIKA